jgi:hypothetical protein
MALKLFVSSLMPHKVRGLPQGWNCCCVRPATPACRHAGKSIEKLMMKLTTKSQIEFGQARY